MDEIISFGFCILKSNAKDMKYYAAFNLILSGFLLISSCKEKVVLTSEDPIQVIAFGSCNRQDSPQPLWKSIIADNPDLWIWMGDNIYGDSPVMDTLSAKYKRQKANPGYRMLISSTSVVGIWDDHDYGINDGGKFFAQKKESRDLLFDFLGVPSNAPDRNREGAYSSHLLGQGKNLVKVILLDARYFRDTLERIDRVYQINEKGEVLGNEQWKWLERELKTSPAKINLIVSGIQILPTEHAYEKWANFPAEREKLLNLISDSGVKNPILLSGDRHIAEVMKLIEPRFPEGLYEITSSGLTHTWNGIAQETNSFRVSELIAKLNYGLATINWEKKEVNIQIKGENGAIYATQKINLE